MIPVKINWIIRIAFEVLIRSSPPKPDSHARLVSVTQIAVPVMRARIPITEKTSNLISTGIPGISKSVKLLNMVSVVIAARRITIKTRSPIAPMRINGVVSQFHIKILEDKVSLLLAGLLVIWIL